MKIQTQKLDIEMNLEVADLLYRTLGICLAVVIALGVTGLLVPYMPVLTLAMFSWFTAGMMKILWPFFRMFI